MQRLQSLPQPIIRLVLGMSYLIIAVGFGIFGTQSARAAAVRIEQIPHIEGVVNQGGKFVCTFTPVASQSVFPGSPEVAQIATGSVVLLEGQISPLNQPHYRDFIAYMREEYRGISSSGSAIWSEDQRETPPLFVDIPGGSVRVANNDYRLDSPHQRWQYGDKLVASNVGEGGSRRYTGMVVGGTVTVIGILKDGPDGPELSTSFVFGGTRAEYIAAQLGAAAYLPWLGLCAAVIGLALIAGNIRRAGPLVSRAAASRADGQVAMSASHLRQGS